MTGTSGQTQTAPPPGPAWSGAQPSPAAEPPPCPAPCPARRPHLRIPLFSGSHGGRCRPSEPASCRAPESHRPDSGLLSKLWIVRGKRGPRWGSHFPWGGHAGETLAGAIGESGGHSWPTTSRKAGAGQTSDAEGLGPLPQASPSSLQQARLAQEPRDSVVCLAVGSGATPLGKEGSLHGPEAIKQDVGQ